MNATLLNIILILLGCISSCPVLLIKLFVTNPIFNIEELIPSLAFFHSAADYTFYYLLSNKISIAVFYPIIKLIEMMIPVLISIIYYKEQLKIINYVGIALAIIAIILIEM